MDLVCGGDYGLHPEARAFIRVQARRIFESGTKIGPAINSTIVTAVQDSSGQLAESSSHMWRILDSFNGAALKQVGVSDTFTAKLADHDKAWTALKRSLCDYAHPDLREMYKKRFHVSDKGLQELSIPCTSPQDSKSPWSKMRDICVNLLTREAFRPQVLFLQGAPGRGKSHLIRDIRTQLKDSRAMFGPLTANPDMVFAPEELDTHLASWRASTGGVLLIDEGNLLPKYFWDRLREDLLADPTKAIVFSGNETFQSGRQPIALAEELGVTLFFEQFSKDEKRSMIEKYAEGIEDSATVGGLILELTEFLENNQFGKSFTPRDLQEVCSWARFFGSSQEELITHIWRVYSPAFTLEQQEGLRVFVHLRYGVDPRKTVQETRDKFNTTYSDKMRQNGFVLRDESLAVATDLAQIVELSRKRGELGRDEGGKRGVIIEAESGWGKDFTVVKTLEVLGYERADLADDDIGDIPASGAKRYYAINAELDFTTLQETIKRAAKEGSVLIVREANALDAGILEAQVNDILTGNVPGVHPAFLTVMTVNSADVESMSAFSSALLSRVHHSKARPHSRETLEEIVGIAEPTLAKNTISKITGLHLYLRDIVGVDGRRPNTRDLLRAASEAVKSDDHWGVAVVDSYLFYIEHGVKGENAIVDSVRFLERNAKEYVSRSEVVPARIMKALAQVGLPRYVGDIKFAIDPGCAKKGADGYFRAKTGSEKAHTIGISPNAITSGRWREVILHEMRHALNDCGEGVSFVFDALEQDIRDLRNQASFADLVPGSGLMDLTQEEQKLVNDVKDSRSTLTSERDFRLLMAVIAKTDDEVLSNSLLKSCIKRSAKHERKVLSVAHKHFDRIREISTCFAKRSFGGEFPSTAELHARQVRLTEIVGEIFEDYKDLHQKERRLGVFGGFESGSFDSSRQDDYDPQDMLRELEKSFDLPPGSLSGPESVTHHSGGASSGDSEHDILTLEDRAISREILKTPELSEEDKEILSEAQSRATQADASPWKSPKDLWEDVVSEWSETSVSNGRKRDPSGSIQMGELFSGVRLEDARVSPGADVDRERKVLRVVDLTSQLTAEDLGLFQELFHLGFTVALGDREPVSSCVALCIQEQGRSMQKSEVEKKLAPAERRRSELLSLEELKSHLEAVAVYAALAKGAELLEQKTAGTDITSAKRIKWPELQHPSTTNELVLYYLEDNQSVLLKLAELTKDVAKSDQETDVELYVKQLEALLDQDKAPESDEKIAQDAIISYEFDEETGVSTFTRPAGVSDVDLMKALNKYFRKHAAHLGRGCVLDGYLKWFDNLPEEHPEHCQERDYSKAKEIRITAVVDGTIEKDRTTAEGVLKNKSLVFSDPRDQAVAAAIHACKYDGEDLFKGWVARGSVPGFALGTCPGVYVGGCDGDGYDDSAVAASGSPSPELE